MKTQKLITMALLVLFSVALGAQKTLKSDDGFLALNDKNLSVNTCESNQAETVSTWTVSKISASTAVCSYSIRVPNASQKMEHGVCWSTSHEPTVNNTKTTEKGYTENTLFGKISGLKPNTTYYVRAYLCLSSGVSYGKEVSFKTLSGK